MNLLKEVNRVNELFEGTEEKVNMFDLHIKYKRLLKSFDLSLDRVCKTLIQNDIDPHLKRDLEHYAKQLIREKTSCMKEYNIMKRGIVQ
jgi:hypothetical protein